MSKLPAIKNLTFDDILKMGAKEATELLTSLVARELEDHDFRIRELATIRIREYRRGKVCDLLKLLEYKNES